jgi:hypothetical protein
LLRDSCELSASSAVRKRLTFLSRRPCKVPVYFVLVARKHISHCRYVVKIILSFIQMIFSPSNCTIFLSSAHIHVKPSGNNFAIGFLLHITLKKGAAEHELKCDHGNFDYSFLSLLLDHYALNLRFYYFHRLKTGKKRIF